MKFNWGHGIVVFFAIFFSFAAVFLVFAFRHKNDLVVKDYYERGANYTEQMTIDKRSLTYQDSIQMKRQTASVLFTFSETILMNGGTLNVHFFRPSNKALDYHIAIPLNQESYDLDTKVLAHGRYEVKLNWSMNGEAYFLKKDINIK
jgi:hypothetical protein